MLVKKIKNNAEETKTWNGQEILAGAYYEIQPTEENRWANNSELLSSIATGEALVNNGSSNILDVNTAINYLKGNIATEVVTQFEKDDKILKLACAYAEVDSEGYANIELKIPGSYENGDGRYVDAGRVWFETHHTGDKIESVLVMDKDGVFGYGPNIVARTWHDEELNEENRGWYIPSSAGGLSVDSMGGYGFIPGELYLQIRAKKGSEQTSGILYLNLKWGKKE